MLRLERNKVGDLREVTIADIDETDPGENLNFTRNALLVALSETGIGGALRSGIPLPVTTAIGQKTEIAEVV